MENDTSGFVDGINQLQTRDIELGDDHRTYSLRHLGINYVLSILNPNMGDTRSIALLKGQGNNDRGLKLISSFDSFRDLHKYFDLLQQIDGLINND